MASDSRRTSSGGEERTTAILSPKADAALRKARYQANACESIRNVLSEDVSGGFLGSATKIQTKVAVFNIGAAISSAIQFATAWHKVEISNLDMPDVFAAGLMNTYSKARRIAGMPKDARVFHGRDSQTGNQLFYFSPAASAIIPKEFKPSSVCPEQPDLAGLREVTF